jgi:PPOX class probable F420-dependent enzyme
VKPYRQSPPLSEEELQAFLDQALVARLGSLNPDGSIHLVPVWFKYEGGDILIGTEESTRKAKNIQRNKNISLLIDSHERPYKGVLIYGQAQLEHDDAVAKRISILARHIPADIAQKVGNDLASQFALITIRIKPQRIISYDDAKRQR